MLATIKKWGNSYAVRLTKKDLRDLRLKPGQRVEILVQPAARTHKPVDISDMPTFSDGQKLSFAEVRRLAYLQKQSWEA